MVGELITLPLRVGVRATRLWLRATEETVAVVAELTGRLIGGAVSNRPNAGRAHSVHQAGGVEAEHVADPERTAVHLEPPAPEPAPADAVEALAEAEPVHVSEEPELVEEVAEPGAEDGAGAAVHVEEPWNGYARMKADDVIDQVAGASPAELAAIRLYESEHKGRVTVLEAVERELRISTGSGSQS